MFTYIFVITILFLPVYCITVMCIDRSMKKKKCVKGYVLEEIKMYFPVLIMKLDKHCRYKYD